MVDDHLTGKVQILLRRGGIEKCCQMATTKWSSDPRLKGPHRRGGQEDQQSAMLLKNKHVNFNLKLLSFVATGAFDDEEYLPWCES